MAVLADGVQYGLSAHGLSSENKSLVFVKLTDSSFKAIEEYLRIKVRELKQNKANHLVTAVRMDVVHDVENVDQSPCRVCVCSP